MQAFLTLYTNASSGDKLLSKWRSTRGCTDRPLSLWKEGPRNLSRHKTEVPVKLNRKLPVSCRLIWTKCYLLGRVLASWLRHSDVLTTRLVDLQHCLYKARWLAIPSFNKIPHVSTSSSHHEMKKKNGSTLKLSEHDTISGLMTVHSVLPLLNVEVILNAEHIIDMLNRICQEVTIKPKGYVRPVKFLFYTLLSFVWLRPVLRGCYGIHYLSTRARGRGVKNVVKI